MAARDLIKKPWFRWFCGALLSMGLLILVLAHLQAPTNVTCTVTGAMLTKFSLTTNNTLNYDLGLEISLRNPNSYYRVRHDHIDVSVNYKNKTFGYATYGTVVQGRDKQTTLALSFRGQVSHDGVVSDFNGTRGNSYDIVAKLIFEDEYKRLFVPRTKTHRILEYTCNLKVLLTGEEFASGNNGFNDTRCSYISIP